MSTSPARPAARALAAITLAGAAAAQAMTGCGGGYREPSAPTADTPAAAPAPAPELELFAAPASPEEAQAQLDRAEAELSSLLGGPQQFASPPSSPASAAQPGTAPPPPPAAPAESPIARKEAAPMGGAVGDRATQVSGNPCVTACRALASMTRAAEHLCGLAGEDDGRCSGARSRVKNATDRVQSQCPACGP